MKNFAERRNPVFTRIRKYSSRSHTITVYARAGEIVASDALRQVSHASHALLAPPPAPCLCFETRRCATNATMGRKGKETSLDERRMILRLHNQCKSSYEIAKSVGRPRSTVQSIIDRFGTTKTLKNQPRSGRPSKLTDRDRRIITREIKKNPKVSAPKLAGELERRGTRVCAATVRNVCRDDGYNGRVARKKFWVSEVNRKKRLAFAKEYISKDLEYWQRVIFSDESKYNLFGSDGRRMVWRKKNTEMQPQNLVPTVKHGGGSLMVWGCMSAAGVGKLHFIEGIMDHKMYINILKENLNASSQKLNLEGKYIFQQDNDPKHKARNTRLWLLYNVPKELNTPPQSPDLNPIEHLWKVLEDNIRKRPISNKKDLKIALQEEWDKISPSVTANLVSSMPRRLQAVIDAKGNPTKY